MNNLINIIGLEDLLSQIELECNSSNFEDVYSELFSKNQYPELLKKIEHRVHNYFEYLELPDNPTIYDYLVLSLRRKDVIATFNWDPLLVDAWERCYKITSNLPHLLFLHGNVRVATCGQCKIIGKKGSLCRYCGEVMEPTKLLYPINEKNYNDDSFIKEQWSILRQAIDQAYTLTIFGYGAPKSDVEAVDLMKRAWGDIENRSMEQIEIIDIKEDDELANTWSEFIHTHHYETHKSFFDSHLWKVPRRSVEAYFEMFFNANFIDTHDFLKMPHLMNWKCL
ncbi:hypothetical protein ACI2OX_21600 [Bacillus sp. N9]